MFLKFEFLFYEDDKDCKESKIVTKSRGEILESKTEITLPRKEKKLRMPVFC